MFEEKKKTNYKQNDFLYGFERDDYIKMEYTNVELDCGLWAEYLNFIILNIRFFLINQKTTVNVF